jgi:hypothetical protein
MNIQTKALIETVKVLGFGVLFGVAFSFFIDFVGMRYAAITLVSALIVWFAYIVYDINLKQLKFEEDSKNNF